MLARLEIYHSRAIAPTRRVALGDFHLPIAPPPGFGGILLGGIVAANASELDDDLHDELTRLTVDIERGRRIRQPRLRNRLQVDRIGLQRSTFTLHGGGEHLEFSFEQTCTPAQALLGALYAAAGIDEDHRHVVVATIRRSMRWGGPVGPDLVARLGGGTGGPFAMSAIDNPVQWAMEMLGFVDLDDVTDAWTPPARREVLTRFRQRLTEEHPDHGADEDGAAQRIADLTEARRILLGR